MSNQNFKNQPGSPLISENTSDTTNRLCTPALAYLTSSTMTNISPSFETPQQLASIVQVMSFNIKELKIKYFSIENLEAENDELSMKIKLLENENNDLRQSIERHESKSFSIKFL